MSNYPYEAGWKDPTVSKENAERLNKLGITRGLMIQLSDLYANGFVGTATQAGDRLGINLLSARPVCSQLYKLGVLSRKEIIHVNGKAHWVLEYQRPIPPQPQGDMFDGFQG